MITDEWYIIDETGLIYHKGGTGSVEFENYLMIGNSLPDYWIERCPYWYDSIDALCEKHSIEML